MDRHTLLTPPAQEGKEGPRCHGRPRPAQLPGPPSSRRLPEPAAYRAVASASLPKLRGHSPAWQQPDHSCCPGSVHFSEASPRVCLQQATRPTQTLSPPLLLLLLLPSEFGRLSPRHTGTPPAGFRTPVHPSPPPFSTLFPAFVVPVKAAACRKASLNTPSMVTSCPSDLLQHSSLPLHLHPYSHG